VCSSDLTIDFLLDISANLEIENYHILIKGLLSILGLLLSALGCSMMVFTYIAPTPYDAMYSLFISKFKNKTLTRACYDGSYLVIAIILGLSIGKLSEQIGVMTFIGYLIYSFFIPLFNKILKLDHLVNKSNEVLKDSNE
jgi:uncharacterized membrane protein YczE